MAAAPSYDRDDDTRGFTTASKNHVTPNFPPTPDFDWSKIPRTHSEPILMPPSVSPDDLDLEDTLVASDSIKISSEDIPAGVYNPGSIRSTSGRTSTTSLPQMSTRRPSIAQRIFGRSSSGSLLSPTAMEVSNPNITSAKALKRELEQEDIDTDSIGLIHSIMRKKYKKERKRPKLLLALLTYSDADVNLKTESSSTALHTAIKELDFECARILVSFGANVNTVDQNGKTPLDLLKADMADMESAVSLPSNNMIRHTHPNPAQKKRHKKSVEIQQSKRQKLIEFLTSVGGIYGELAHRVSNKPHVEQFPVVRLTSQQHSSSSEDKKQKSEVLFWDTQLTFQYNELERNIRRRMHNTSSAGDVSFSSDEAISIAQQLREMHRFKRAGSRILCLDGGGIRGLVQIEVLSQLEQETGRKITELFDWIIGTSTGAVIALGLVYANKSISQLRQLYFRMKDEIFGQTRHGGVSYNTDGLERVLKEEFKEHLCMDDVTYPRVLISAVKKEHINLKLHFFNNCFNDEYCKHWPVWKVARYTSAGPVIFGEADDYVDGGLLANDPSESGLTRIQQYYKSRGEKLPVSLLVSIGSGKYPNKELGKVNYLFYGSHGGFDLTHLKDRLANLMSLLSYALVETSVSSNNCKSRCEEQDIRYFRLNPRMEQVVDTGETDPSILLDMILQARKEISQRPEFSNLVLCFHELSEASRRMHAHMNRQDFTHTLTTRTSTAV